MKFEVGNRVRFYGNSQIGAIDDVPDEGIKGTVRRFHGIHWLDINTDSYGEITVHVKQCRKLKPKKHRSVWVVFDEIGVCREFSSLHPSKLHINQNLDWIECREVTKK